MVTEAKVSGQYPRHQLGRRGEELAADFFVRRGYSVVARNWSCREGELDLVILKGDELRIIEVKTRKKNRSPMGPAEVVGDAKLDKLWETAAWFLEAHPALPRQPHLDVMCVTFTKDVPIFQWLKNFE